MNRLIALTFSVLALLVAEVHAQEVQRGSASNTRVAATGHTDGQLFRHTTINQAWAALQQSRKPMFLYVTSDNCFYCKKMLQETYSHPQIRAAIASYCEPVSFNATDSAELAKRLGVRAYPTTLVISPENQLLHKIEGFVEPAEFAKQVWPVFRQAEQNRRVAMRSIRTDSKIAPAAMQQETNVGRQAVQAQR